MKKLIFISILLTVQLGFSQLSIKKNTIDSGGDNVTIGSTTLLYTIGEGVVQESTVGGLQVSEGFISADLQDALAVDGFLMLEGVSVFPNPAINYISIQFSTLGNYVIELTDLNGKQLSNHEAVDAEAYRLDMTTYSSGVYLVSVKDRSKQQYKVYKIIKN